MRIPMVCLVLTLAFTEARGAAVLLPINVDVEGANGSRFETEARVFNPSGAAVELPETLLHCLRDYPRCEGDLFRLPPGETRLIAPEGTPGLVIDEPAVAVEAGLRYSIRVRDVSRTDKSSGVEIPVVRPADFSNSVHLLGVSSKSQARTRLRIYAIGGRSVVQVAYVDEVSGTTIQSGSVSLAKSVDEPRCPYFAELVVPEFVRSVRVEINVERLGAVQYAPVWAFVTTTNNITQEITVTTPSR